jgi:Glyoxalase/Bleomycin resistance protein/Dioxygenase superfamily
LHRYHPQMSSFHRIAPVFPVRDIDLACTHYEKLGFSVRQYDGPASYAFVERSGVELHLALVDDLQPATNMSAVYLYVSDADALYEEWNQAGIDGRLIKPQDTDYGLREGACLDRDANLIRFGSEL